MKWIKVTDKLPKIGKKVIVRDAKGIAETYKLTEHGWNLQNKVLGSNEPTIEWLDETELVETKYGKVVLSDEGVHTGFALEYEENLVYITGFDNSYLPINYARLNSTDKNDWSGTGQCSDDGRIKNIEATIGFKLAGIQELAE